MHYFYLVKKIVVVYCLVYLSSSLELVSPQTLIEMEHQGQIRNKELSITGLLLYLNGSTLHVLEGDKDQLFSDYELISQDRRQSYVTILYQSPITRRLFSGWHLNYKVGNIRQMHQFDALGEVSPAVESIMVSSILRSFYETNYRN